MITGAGVFMTATIVGVSTSAFFAAVKGVQLLKQRLANEKRKTELIRIETKEKIEQSLEGPIEYLIEIEEHREAITSEKSEKARSFADQARLISESLDKSRKKIDLQLLKIKANYTDLVEFGNVCERSDGTYEVIHLSPLSGPREEMARMAIDRDNEYIEKSNEVYSIIDKFKLDLESDRDDLSSIARSSPKELLEKHERAVTLYREAVQDIIAAYKPGKLDQEVGPGNDPKVIDSGSEIGREQSNPQGTQGANEGAAPQGNEVERGSKFKFRSSSERLLELAEEANTPDLRGSEEEMGMGG